MPDQRADPKRWKAARNPRYVTTTVGSFAPAPNPPTTATLELPSATPTPVKTAVARTPRAPRRGDPTAQQQDSHQPHQNKPSRNPEDPGGTKSSPPRRRCRQRTEGTRLTSKLAQRRSQQHLGRHRPPEQALEGKKTWAPPHRHRPGNPNLPNYKRRL